MSISTGTALEIAIEDLGKIIHEINLLNGWDPTTEADWDGSTYKIPADLALVTSEVSEALEAFRHNDREGFAEEMADVVIRVIGLTHGLKIDLAAAVAAKIAKNRERGYKHGGKRL